jgi:hypothetical protein
MWAVRPIQESRFLSLILKLTSSLKSILAFRPPSMLVAIFRCFSPFDLSCWAPLQIWILAESKGAYWSYQEQTKTTFWNQFRPSNVLSLYRQVCSTSASSLMLSYVSDTDPRHFFRSHIPALKS